MSDPAASLVSALTLAKCTASKRHERARIFSQHKGGKEGTFIWRFVACDVVRLDPVFSSVVSLVLGVRFSSPFSSPIRLPKAGFGSKSLRSCPEPVTTGGVVTHSRKYPFALQWSFPRAARRCPRRHSVSPCGPTFSRRRRSRISSFARGVFASLDFALASARGPHKSDPPSSEPHDVSGTAGETSSPTRITRARPSCGSKKTLRL